MQIELNKNAAQCITVVAICAVIIVMFLVLGGAFN